MSAGRRDLYFDISKLVDDPRRTGIQRVERELVRHWPEPGRLIPCRFERDALWTLPAAIMDALAGDAPPGGIAAERALLAPHLAAPGSIVPQGARLLCAELFDDPDRAAYHRVEAAHAFWLVYDFLPWLQPEWFPAGPANRLMPFLHAMRDVAHRGFISAAIRRDAAERIFRRPEPGPVLPLGADGLGLERQRFDPGRRDVVMLGTIEARKNAAAALAAFRTLWAEGSDVRLVLIGAVEPDALAERALLRELGEHPGLLRLGVLPDAGVRDALRRARVLLFPSQGEGYGLPPMEALHSGIPVIAVADLPALDGLPADGQIRLEHPNADSIAQAVRSLMDDGVARRLWAEAARMVLPGWAEFARAVADWVDQGVGESARVR